MDRRKDTEGLASRLSAMEAELAALRDENWRLRQLLGLNGIDSRQASAWRPTLFSASQHTPDHHEPVDHESPREAKVALFRHLFMGRTDVYALRWENERNGKAGWSPAVRGGWSKARDPDREYLPFTEEVVEAHLAGRVDAGLYPLLPGDTCRLLACDFDGPGWLLDALAYFDAAKSLDLPVGLERSRSGDGGHVWLFFADPVPAASARRIGVQLLREAMTVRGELDLVSYDRLFPAQDYVPKGSFGNLIALPLQGRCRRRGTTLFLDRETLDPFADQWEFLSSIVPLSGEQVQELARAFGELAAGPEASTYQRPVKDVPPPPVIRARSGAMLAVDRIGVPPALLSALKHLASVHNPEFHEKERLRLSTWNTPRMIRCYGETIDQLLLPRGLRDRAIELVADAGSCLEIIDESSEPGAIDAEFMSVLTPEQKTAVDALSQHDLGMLVAPPGSGKTVVGCAVLARRSTPTLVIVDRKPLVEQWRDRLLTHLGLDTKRVGQIGGGRKRSTGVIDVAMIQSLARHDEVAELTAQYGLVIVDECHHVPAVTFERIVRQIPAWRWLGLTATPYRRDGLQALMAMYCGPVRHSMTMGESAGLRALDLIVHETRHEPAFDVGAHIQESFRALVEDEERTAAICGDIVEAAGCGRNCLVLTRWTKHLDAITADLSNRGIEPLVLHGNVGTKKRVAVVEQLASPPAAGGLVLVATASLLGEGFDCPPLDTLFLAFPIRFKGNVVQCVGRILRPTSTKSRVEVHDYVDVRVPVIARMHDERRSAYRALGFELPERPRRIRRTVSVRK